MKISDLIIKTADYFGGDPKRINHFMKVYSYAVTIAEGENVNDRLRFIIETAAVVHDVGIKPAEQKYHSSAGKYQELLGPQEAEKLLYELNCPQDVAERVKYLVAHHHTYDNADGIDYRILIESDFLTNAYEDGLSKESIVSARDKIFRTDTGIKLLNVSYKL